MAKKMNHIEILETSHVIYIDVYPLPYSRRVESFSFCKVNKVWYWNIGPGSSEIIKVGEISRIISICTDTKRTIERRDSRIGTRPPSTGSSVKPDLTPAPNDSRTTMSISLRDWRAMLVMIGFAANNECNDKSLDYLARQSYNIADALETASKGGAPCVE